MTTVLLLIRHGETVWNVEGRVQGHGDSQLSERGLAQARALASRLTNLPIKAIYCSDAGRAVATIEPFASAASVPVEASPKLREKCFGDWEGLTGAEIGERYPDLWHNYHVERRLDTVIPGGETWGDVAQRTVGFLREVIVRHSDETIAIIGHGGSLRPPILHALKAPLNCLRQISVDNCGISTLRFKTPDDGRVISLNDCHHLDGIP